MDTRMKLINISIEIKETFPKGITFDNYSFININAIGSVEEISEVNYLLTLSKEKAYEYHCLEPNLLENLEHINIYTVSDPLITPNT